MRNDNTFLQKQTTFNTKQRIKRQSTPSVFWRLITRRYVMRRRNKLFLIILQNYFFLLFIYFKFAQGFGLSEVLRLRLSSLQPKKSSRSSIKQKEVN
jgi:hypothetical protein